MQLLSEYHVRNLTLFENIFVADFDTPSKMMIVTVLGLKLVTDTIYMNCTPKNRKNLGKMIDIKLKLVFNTLLTPTFQEV